MYPESIEVHFLDLATLTELSERIRKKSEDLKFEIFLQGLVNRISDHTNLGLQETH